MQSTPQTLFFTKMNGLGNDFIIFDTRKEKLNFTLRQIRNIANRKIGIGCDQLIILHPQRSPNADVFMQIINADGSEVAACGNATRCIAYYISQEIKKEEVIVETLAGLLYCKILSDSLVEVDMGVPSMEWEKIPLSKPQNTQSLELSLEANGRTIVSSPSAVNIGNPHVIFFVEDLETLNFNLVGSTFERHTLFPEGVNVSCVQVLNSSLIKSKIWERGVGLTEACGSAACACVFAAMKRGFINSSCKVIQPGGELLIKIENEKIKMIGPISISFSGTIHPSLLML